MFKELLIESKEVTLFIAPKERMEKIDDALLKWNEANDYAFQDYYTQDTGNGKRAFIIEDPEKFKKYKKDFMEIIKKIR
jgi:hypothetical protein